MDAVTHGFRQMVEKLPRRPPLSLVDQLSDSRRAGAVDADEQVKFAFGGLHLVDGDVEEADGIAFEALSLQLVALDIR